MQENFHIEDKRKDGVFKKFEGVKRIAATQSGMKWYIDVQQKINVIWKNACNMSDEFIRAL